MRIDHIAWRVKDRHKTSSFFINAFGYKIQQEFQIKFDDGTTADCIALEPPEKVIPGGPWNTWISGVGVPAPSGEIRDELRREEYHMAPELFVSDGVPGSIVGEWVKARGGIGGIHHMAYQVESVEETMKEWQEKGYAEFTSQEPMRCPEDNLVQIFTKPSALTGVIFEFIERGSFGFCNANVKALMESSKNCK